MSTIKMTYHIEDDLGHVEAAARFDISYTDDAHMSEDARYSIYLSSGSVLTEIMRYDHDAIYPQKTIYPVGVSSLGTFYHQGVFQRTGSTTAEFSLADTVNDDVTTILSLWHALQIGYGQDGMGTRLLYELPNDAGTKKEVGAIDTRWGDASDGSEDSVMSFCLVTSGGSLIENLRIVNKAIKLLETTDPPNAADAGFIYTKDDSGDTELFFEDDGGNVVQITEDGQLACGGGGGDSFVSLISSYHGYRPTGTVVDSDFYGTIATLPGGANLTYNAGFTGDADYLDPYDGTNQQGKLVLHNTTRGNSALISDCVPGTRTITLTDNVPGDWAVSDVITIRSQTCTTAGPNYYFDVDMSDVLPADATVLVVWALLRATNSNQRIYFHPYESWGEGKLFSMYTQAADMLNQCTMFISLNSRRICIMGDFGGSYNADIFGFKTVGYFQPAS